MQIRGSNVAKWRQAVGVACLAALPGAVPLAGAFGLGQVQVLSALGQPLSANIQITDLGAGDAQSLQVGIAPGTAYQERKLSYSSALDGATLSLQRDAYGHPYLHLSGVRPASEPFVDLLVRAYWPSGEITRNYTLLLDPPGFHEAGVAAVAPQVRAPVARAVQQAMPATALASGQATSYTVQRGDTLYSIARSYAGGAVSLDQMLAALYSDNHAAFIGGNINRLRAGAVLKVPSAGQAEDFSPSQAHELIVAHSGDFGAYRRRLAELSPTASTGNPRSMHGAVRAQVNQPQAGASAPQSRLRLSQASVAAPTGGATQANWQAAQQEAQALAEKLAQARADVAALARMAASASAAARALQPALQSAGTSASPSTGASVPALALPASTPTHPASAALAAASAARPAASAALAAASAARPSASAATRNAVPAKPSAPEKHPAPAHHAPPPPPARPSGRGLLSNPLLAPAGLLIGLLLLGWALLRRRGSGRSGRSSVFDSRGGSTDSFFGASGGERVDTHNSTLGSSMQYSPSQVESVDVDPVAEADVYLAYGRDLQAEEILKEALKSHPERNAARLKLLEIYAKRKDARSFELMAAELFTRTDGGGEDWKRAQEIGRDLDPVNPLYHNTQPPSLGSAPTTMTPPDFDGSQSASSLTESGATVPPTELLAGLPSLSMGGDGVAEAGALDLALDLGAGVATDVPNAAAPSAPTATVQQAPALEEPDLNLQFDLSSLSAEPAAAGRDAATPPATEPPPLEFDLGNLGLEPLPEPTAPVAPSPGLPAQSLDTRLALVEECRAMGDLETARNLLHEIIAESEGETRVQAEKLLAELG